MDFDFLSPFATLAVAFPALAVAYIIFGITGFGTALIAAPVLAHAMPVATIVPLLALLDCLGAAINGVRLGEHVARRELILIVPLMVLGSLAGAWLLLVLPPRPMMLALGVFVVLYALYGLWAPPARAHLAQGWVAPFGLIGGVFSAMFGSGGFIYAMYLSRRLAHRDAIRATQSTLIALSTFTRVVIFTLAGVYADWQLLALAVLLVPAMLAGLWAGHHITLRLSRERFLRLLYLVLIGSGLALLVRAMAE
jgi:uncharacterized membrane protein YfcA